MFPLLEMKYKAENPKAFYAILGEKEFDRLTRNRLGDLLYHSHIDVIKTYIKADHDVLELGAGAGIYSKELVNMCNTLVVSDITPKQLEFNKRKMQELNLLSKIKEHLLLDVTDLRSLDSESFNAVVCVGGALNYTMEKKKDAIKEMLRITKKDGILIVGVMSLISAIFRYMNGVIEEKGKFGINATRWLFETGIQDEEHYPVKSKHYVQMFRCRDLDELFEDESVNIIDKRASGLFALVGEESLNKVKVDNELWNLILEKEIEYSKLPGTLECGANLVYTIQKI